MAGRADMALVVVAAAVMIMVEAKVVIKARLVGLEVPAEKVVWEVES